MDNCLRNKNSKEYVSTICKFRKMEGYYMKRIQALINKETLIYIIKGKKVSTQYLLKHCKCKPEVLDSWLDLSSTLFPTIQQAKKLARCLHIPFVALYMNSADIKLKSIPSIKNLRTIQNSDTLDDSLLNLTILDLLTERDFLIEAKKELGIKSELFCADVPESSSPKVWADEIRRYFSLDLNIQFDSTNARQFYLYLRSQVEKKGIFVQCFKGMEVEAIRGIALYEQEMPIIGINDNDRHPGKIFSIIHEIVHIYKRQSSFCNEMYNSYSTQQEEVFCNAVAGEVLVPTETIREIISKQDIESVSDIKNIEKLSKIFSVSKEVIIRKLYDMQIINREQYNECIELINIPNNNSCETKQTTRKNNAANPKPRNMSKAIIDRTSSEICKVLYEGFCEKIYDEIYISEYLGLNLDYVGSFLSEVAEWDN